MWRIWRRCGRQLGGFGNSAATIGRRRQCGVADGQQCQKSVPDSHSPKTIPAKAGISQCRVCNNRQIRPRFPFPPKTIPAKAGISQCRVCNNRQIRPRFPFPPKTIPAKAGISQCRAANNRQIRPRFPFSPQTIPAKAGISQCRVCNNAKNPSPIPVPPVDHSCEGRNLTVSCRQQSPNSPPIPIHRRPFLRRQESHSIVSPNVAGKGVAL